MLPIYFTAPPALASLPHRWNRHLPYAEAAPGALTELEGVRVRNDAREPLARLLEAARKDGVRLRIAAGFRSVEQQRQLFVSGAKKKGITKESYAWWTAPPGFSEHHSGLAVDFTEEGNPRSDFNPEVFRKTAAFAWLRARAAQFGFELSFPENNGKRVAFEPWHWRYVGDDSARAIFAVARAGRLAQDGSIPGKASTESTTTLAATPPAVPKETP